MGLLSRLFGNKERQEAEARRADLEAQLADQAAQADKDRQEAEARRAELESKLADQTAQADKDRQEAESRRAELETKLADAEKKVAKLKKENDDLEDEIKELNNDLNKVKKEKQETEVQKGALEHDLKKAGQENENLVKAKAAIEDDRKGKERSLDFVGELLNAQEQNGDIKKTEQAVDALVDFIRHDLPVAYAEADIDFTKPTDPADPQSDEALTRWAARAKKTWLNDKKAIAFVGEFSAGKTSIVNRILGSKDLLAVSTEATTAIPTYIIGGEKQSFCFVSPDDKMKAISESSFRMVSKQVLANVKGAPKLLKYFVMTSNVEGLGGISILDTPGFSSNDSEDATRTIDVINECDALYWVFDVNNGTVNRSSIKLIKENLHRPLFVVINKCDTKSKGEADKVEILIRQTLQKEGVEVRQFLRFGKDADPAVLLDPLAQIEKEGDDTPVLSHLEVLCRKIGRNEGEYSYNGDCEKQSREEVDACEKEFKSDCEKMVETCEEIEEFVKDHWEKNWILCDQYELSKEDGGWLISRLQDLSRKAEENEERIKYFPDIVESAFQSTADLNKNKDWLKTLRAAQKKFLQKIDAFKPDFSKDLKNDTKDWVKQGRKDYND